MFDRYGSREFGGIAHECDAHGGYHVNAESYIVEIVRDGRPALPGESGDVAHHRPVEPQRPADSLRDRRPRRRHGPAMSLRPRPAADRVDAGPPADDHRRRQRPRRARDVLRRPVARRRARRTAVPGRSVGTRRACSCASSRGRASRRRLRRLLDAVRARTSGRARDRRAAVERDLAGRFRRPFADGRGALAGEQSAAAAARQVRGPRDKGRGSESDGLEGPALKSGS